MLRARTIGIETLGLMRNAALQIPEEPTGGIPVPPNPHLSPLGGQIGFFRLGGRSHERNNLNNRADMGAAARKGP